MSITVGTTPRNTFTLSIDPPAGSEFVIVYAQGKEYEEKVLFEVENRDISADGKKLSVRLTREQTLKFDAKPHWQSTGYLPYPVKIQIGITLPGGNILWSRIILTTVERCLKEEGVVNV